MSNYTAVARSNYVKIDDLEKVKEALKPFDIKMEEFRDGSGYYAFLETSGKGWYNPTFVSEGDSDNPSLPFIDDIIPYVAEGEVLIFMELGNETKLSGFVGYAAAFCRKGKVVEEYTLDLADIYDIAADRFGKCYDDVSHIS